MHRFLKTCFFSSLLALSAISASIIDVAIIGSGCSGLSAAYVTSEFGYKTHVFSGPHKGGDLNVNTIVGNWMGIETTTGNEIIPIIEESVADNEGKIVRTEIASVDFTKSPMQLVDTKGNTYFARKVVIATGTKDKPVPLVNIPNPQGRIYYNWDIHPNLSKFKSQVSNKDVSIIGGGVDAMKKAFYALKGGAKKVRIFTRSETLRLPPWRQKFIKRSKIQPVYKHSLEKVEGIGKKLRLYFEGGKTEEADIVVISMGRIPNSNLFRRKVKMDQKGFIIVDAKTQKTSVPNVYACGDVTDASGPQPQAMIAAGNGMIAGYTIVEDFLKEGVMPSSL